VLELIELTKSQDLFGLENSWNDLLANSGSDNPFSTFEWIATWWKHFGKDKDLLLLAVKVEGRLIGLAPLMVDHLPFPLFPLKRILFIGHGLSDYADFLITEQRVDALKLILNYLQKSNQWSLLELAEIPETSPNLPILRELILNWPLTCKLDVLDLCPYLPLDGTFDTYYQGLSRHRRKDLTQKQNKLSQLGKFEFHVFNNEDLDPLLQSLIEIHQKRRRQLGDTSLFNESPYQSFLKEMTATFAARNWLDLEHISLNGSMISFSLGFRYKQSVFNWIQGFDPQYSRFSPGQIVLLLKIKEAFRKDITNLDFTRGEEVYKMEWTSLARANYQFLSCRGILPHLLFHYYNSIRPRLANSRTFLKTYHGLRRVVKTLSFK